MNLAPASPGPSAYLRPAPTNDNSRPLLLGLTGLRNVGKSTVAEMLEEECGFVRCHAFAAGKEAARTYFAYIVGDPIIADEMVYGELKDQPCASLPDGVSPRYFLERFGHFMGATMGTSWTLGLEIAIARRRYPGRSIVVESLVYEAPWFKAQGGKVLRLVRPGHAGPQGLESDSVQAGIVSDAVIVACDVDSLKREARAAVQQMVGGG